MITTESDFSHRPNWIFYTAGFVLFSLIVIAFLTAMGWIGGDYALANPDFSYHPPSFSFLLGTDLFGRSLLYRNMHALKTALFVGFMSASLSTLIGVALGALSGFYGGFVDRTIRWVYTSLDSVPYILLISGLSFSLGQGISNVFIVLGATGWVKLCRLIRGEFIVQKNGDYIRAAKGLGYSNLRKMFVHILPNTLHIAIVQFGIFFVFAIKMEVILSFLGLGVEVGTPSWGVMMADARAELPRGVWWNFASTTGLMFCLVFSINLVVDRARQLFRGESS